MTYENQGGIEVLIVLLDIVCVILGRLPLVHSVEVGAGVVGLDGLEESFESILKTVTGQGVVTRPA